MCRDNGLVRWPYRKVVSGKAIEEFNKEASATMSPTAVETMGAQFQDGLPNYAQDALKLQRGASLPDHLLPQQGSRFFQSGRQNQNLIHSSHARTIPTYLDEFKQGFPSDGLSSVSMRWWGSMNLDDAEKIPKEEPTNIVAAEQKSHEFPSDGEMTEGKPERDTEKDAIGPQGAALLSSVRKRAVEDGREAVKLSVARGYGPYKLGRKERVLLAQVFQSSYPSIWR
ncbi:uncharacterized protein LOC131240787 isoform X2 [Magnolia sinica]|nr:uncharacterized protein LOC131240787 isoform X2 [Magnolia sinica]